MALKWLVAGVTQGSADAFAEAEFNTGLSNVTRTAYRIRRLEWSLPTVIGADSNAVMCLRRNSSASVTFAGSNAIIATRGVACELTTSGMIVYQTVLSDSYARDEELLIVEESLFLQVDSTGTSATNTGYVRIGYETRTITENERLAIQAATASG